SRQRRDQAGAAGRENCPVSFRAERFRRLESDSGRATRTETLARDGGEFMIIDADGHTQIPQEVFDKYLDKEFYRNRPRFVTFDDGRGFYLIEGRVITKPFGWGPGTPGSIANSTPTLAVKDLDLSNVPGRLADLDLEGIELQVIYPNVLMSINSLEHSGLATAIARAYNTWISERCA